jgi:hypothetical protein
MRRRGSRCQRSGGSATNQAGHEGGVGRGREPAWFKLALRPAWAVCQARANLSRWNATLELPRGPGRTTDRKPAPPFPRDRHRPKERGPDRNPHTDRPRHSSARTSNIGLRLSFSCLADGLADLPFLVMMRVVAAISAHNDRARKPGMTELPMRSLAARSEHESSLLQVRNQLAYLARHCGVFSIIPDTRRQSRRRQPATTKNSPTINDQLPQGTPLTLQSPHGPGSGPARPRRNTFFATQKRRSSAKTRRAFPKARCSFPKIRSS